MALAQPNIFTEEDYYRLPEDMRAELIGGQFYGMSAPSRTHQRILGYLYRIIGNHIASRNGSCEVYPAPFAVKLFEDDKTIVEPDISVICDQDKLTDKGCTGAPDWIIEIVSPGNPAYDYVRKLNLYLDAGVREYWIVDPIQKSIHVYHLVEERFKMISYTFQDEIKAGIYDDLCIDFKELGL